MMVFLAVDADFVADVSPSVDHDVVLANDEDIPLLVGDVSLSAGVQVAQPAKKGRGRKKGKGGGK